MTSEPNESIGDVAIIGMSGCFPGAPNLEVFWCNLCEGKESITFFDDEDLRNAGICPSRLTDPSYVKAKGTLADADKFDAGFFGYTPREAQLMDPQHRLFLEHSWLALEDAGYVGGDPDQLIAVFGGARMNTYAFDIYSTLGSSFDVEDVGFLIGNDKDYLTSRVAYQLNLGGPSVTVQSACSTSLVAVGLAVQSLLDFQADIALAGGVRVSVPIASGYSHHPGGMLSPDGHCRAFDADGQGTVFGDGVGVVAIKRLEDALQDRDHIYAVIKGYAISNDSGDRASFTAPGVGGQAQAISMALAAAGAHPSSISYIECHGTGTPLGDPIEIEALKQVFGESRGPLGECALGSVKTNIGHTSAAAGIAGLLKTVLALQHRRIPPSLHFRSLNSHIDLLNTPFHIQTELGEWEQDKGLRRAGVSSFGLGGTNCHVVLEEAPCPEPSDPPGAFSITPLSAKTETALQATVGRLVDYLEREPEINLRDVAHSLQVGRRSFEHRCAVVGATTEEVIGRLGTLYEGSAVRCTEPVRAAPKIVFMFPGQGAQRLGMGQGLPDAASVYQSELSRCVELFQSTAGLDLLPILDPRQKNADQARRLLAQTRFAQPALFSVELALARQLMALGIQPARMIGHSLGEYVAACLAGVLSLPDAVRVVAWRAQAMQEMPQGAMLAVWLSEVEAASYVRDGVHLAAVNESSLCVLSGPTQEITALELELERFGIASKRLEVSHAFHSDQMNAAADQLADKLAEVDLGSPAIPFISCKSGNWINDEEALSPEYWRRQMLKTVRFDDGLDKVLDGSRCLLLEVGPGTALAAAASRRAGGGHEAISVLGKANDARGEERNYNEAVGKVWVSGYPVDWPQLDEGARRRRIPLPTYPFERQRYWIEAAPVGAAASVSPDTEERRNDVSDWFYTPSWGQVPRRDPTASPTPDSTYLVFSDATGLAAALVNRLRASGARVEVARSGPEYSADPRRHSYVLDPGDPQHYHRLLSEMKEAGGVPSRVIHCWTLSGADGPEFEEHDVLSLGFYSLAYLAQAVNDLHRGVEVKLDVVTNHLQDVFDHERVDFHKATLLGPVKVIPQEFELISSRCIDIDWNGKYREDRLRNLLTEIHGGSQEQMVALRGDQRWVQRFEPMRLEAEAASLGGRRLQHQGIYLITGGLGGIGLVIAEYLARTVQARLVLLGRTEMPPREDWPEVLSESSDSRLCDKIRQIQQLESLGAEVRVAVGDVAARQQMEKIVSLVEETWGTVDGVVHSAGVPGGSLIANLRREVVEMVFAPKVTGTMVLAEVFEHRPLDFLILFSSQTSLLGRFGQIAYCAANAFLDAYARSNKKSRCPLLTSVNWDLWAEVGMAVETNVPEELRQWRQESLDQGIRPEEGMAAFEKLLAVRWPQIVVSTRDFRRLVSIRNVSEAARFRTALKNISLSKPNRSHSVGEQDYAPPRNAFEQSLVETWEELLGITGIGIRDNFLELGGHSLVATMMISRLRKTTGREIALHTFLENPTISAISDAARDPQKVPSSRSGMKLVTARREAYLEEAPPLRIEADEQDGGGARRDTQVSPAGTQSSGTRPIDFSLFFFSADESNNGKPKYDFLIKSAEFADRHGFRAVWTPERHFNRFGGLFSNPALTSAALAMVTEKVSIRAGSVILPLHNPIRVAEEWAMVDNLSGGRAAVAFGSGWHVNDFILAPQLYQGRKQEMLEGISRVRDLWRRRSLSFSNGAGNPTQATIFPKPVQNDLPIWLTAESPETFRIAGEKGWNLLTALLHQELPDLEANIKLYRQSLEEHGFDPESRTVTLMQHTFLGDDLSAVESLAATAFEDYIRTNMGLQRSNTEGLGMKVSTEDLSESDIRDLAAKTFERHLTATGLIGTPELCRARVEASRSIGVDEIACLIDFIPDSRRVLDHLRFIAKLRDLSSPTAHL